MIVNGQSDHDLKFESRFDGYFVHHPASLKGKLK